MWWQPSKPVFEKPIFMAIIGGAAVIVFVAMVTFGVQHWPLWRHTYTLDSYVPRDAQIYLHVDLSAGQMRRWDSSLARARWSTLLTAFEEKIKPISSTPVEMSDLVGSIGSEMAFAQRTVAGQPENILLIKARSASKFETVLKQMVPSHLLPQEKNVWISDDVSKIFSIGAAIVPQLEVAFQHVYWMEAGDDVYILSSTPKFITDTRSAGGKYRNSIGDAMAGYRSGEPFISGFLPQENIWPSTGADDDFRDITAPFDDVVNTPVYVEVNVQNEYAWGQMRNYSQRLFDRLSTSDAESVALATGLELPPQYRVAYLKLPLGKIFEQLSESDTSVAPLQSWMTFVKQQLGADWTKEIAPIVNVPADLILGPVDDTNQPQSFLLALLPQTTEAQDTQLNNLEALFRRLAGQLYPREIETTLTDGTKVIELVPDPQTNAWHAWTGEGARESFQVMDLPTGGQILLGRLGHQNIISNSTDLLKAVAQSKTTIEPTISDCLKRIHGNELIVLPASNLTSQNSLISRFNSLYLANGSEGKRTSLMFCLMLPQTSNK